MGRKREQLDAQPGLRIAMRRFREIFPRGFRDKRYLEWERGYKWSAHVAWQKELDRSTWQQMLEAGAYREIARRIARLYSRSKLNMLALYEWMALREALDDARGARMLARGLFDMIHGHGDLGRRLDDFTAVLDGAPQRQTRLAKWPVATLFPFIAQPRRYLILKPNLMKRASSRLGFPLDYRSRPNGITYGHLMSGVARLWRQLEAWRPRDLIDIQGFLWVTSSDEYEDWPWD